MLCYDYIFGNLYASYADLVAMRGNTLVFTTYQIYIAIILENKS